MYCRKEKIYRCFDKDTTQRGSKRKAGKRWSLRGLISAPDPLKLYQAKSTKTCLKENPRKAFFAQVQRRFSPTQSSGYIVEFHENIAQKVLSELKS